MKELGALIGPGIRIELASDTPIFCRLYRHSDMKRELIRSRTLELLEARLVELSHSEYALATVMPVKKDVHGNYTDRRMCGNHRLINRQTKADKYAMPTPKEIFDVIVLKRLRAHGLRLHPGKCKFFYEKVEYLSHVIYPCGLKVQQAKVEAIAHIPHPADVSRVRAFMVWRTITRGIRLSGVHRLGVANLNADGLSRNPCISQEDDIGARWHNEVDEEVVPDWHASDFMCWIRGASSREDHLTSYSSLQLPG
ncbi:hypothetical protein AXG93_230s1020 [Marchantia polymorpha subsp. ruderalis]|uniref:Reverse transcriptase domain-containing protein n=1 Tax=Marchantia polymorpha subsp. ruderalis TaxID=1480154 RepID=A0A176WNE1_MARPO|nr:hypothetical protein AXG93_230s1020 [Marchantia polymorpha subsp. ruderalis]